MLQGDYILVAGCNKQCVIMSSEGVKLGTVGEEQESWIWSCKAHPTSSFVVRSNIQSFSLLVVSLFNISLFRRYSVVKMARLHIFN